MCSCYFFILKIAWLLLKTFQCFLKNVQLLPKIYSEKTEIYLKEKMCSCFLELCPLKKYFEVKNSLKTKMMFMYFWLNYCYENHHIERIPVAVQNINHLFRLASEIIETDRLHLFLLSDGTRIYEGKYLSSLENGIELIICTEEQIQKLSIYFELKRYLSLKNISYTLNIDYFIWRLATFWVAALLK